MAGFPDDHHQEHEFMSANSQLDPDGELLPIQWYVELLPIQWYVELCTAAARWSCHLAESVEQWVLDSDTMNDGAVTTLGDVATALGDEPIAFTSGADGQSLCAHVERDVNLT